MKTTKPRAVLINFDFPPNEGIGGRRWGYLANELAKHFELTVLKAEPHTQAAPTSKGIGDSSFDVIELKRKYPKILSEKTSSIFQKLLYRIALAYLKITHKGTIYDQSIGWEKELLPQLKAIQKKQEINWIFATGAPFNMLYHIAKWKSNYSNIKLWVDFRDPWLNAQNYGMKSLSHARMQNERFKARVILQNAKIISTPAIQIFEEFEEILKELKSPPQLYELKHYYVGNTAPSSEKTNSDSIQITYGGEIYIGLESHLAKLDADLLRLKKNRPAWYEKLKINFYVRDKSKLKELSKHENVIIHDVIGNEIEQVIAASDWCLILLAFHNKDFFTTKYFEFQKLQTPFLYLGDNGLVSQRIQEEKRGMTWDNLFSDLLEGKNGPYQHLSNTPNKQDSVTARGSEIIDLIKKIEHEYSAAD